MKYSLTYRCVCHKGLRRKINQDNFLCERKYKDEDCFDETFIEGRANPSNACVFAVFDGMGGEEKGEVAAQIAAKSFSEQSLKKVKESTLISYALQANREICDFAKNNQISAMGTTVALLCFIKHKIRLCNVGDSKIFRFSEDGLKQISIDHISISAFGGKPPLTQNLGIPETELIISPYTTSLKYKDGDVFLICSDGLSDMVSVEQMEFILRSASEVEAAKTLVKAALDNGGKDNITVIVIYVKKRRCRIFRNKKGRKTGYGNY